MIQRSITKSIIDTSTAYSPLCSCSAFRLPTLLHELLIGHHSPQPQLHTSLDSQPSAVPFEIELDGPTCPPKWACLFPVQINFALSPASRMQLCGTQGLGSEGVDDLIGLGRACDAAGAVDALLSSAASEGSGLSPRRKEPADLPGDGLRDEGGVWPVRAVSVAADRPDGMLPERELLNIDPRSKMGGRDDGEEAAASPAVGVPAGLISMRPSLEESGRHGWLSLISFASALHSSSYSDEPVRAVSGIQSGVGFGC